MALRTESEQKAHREGREVGTLCGVGLAIHLLMEGGVAPEHHEPLHEYIDFAEARNGDLKREPRSQLGKEAKRDGTGPWQVAEGSSR